MIPARSASRSPRPSAISRGSATAASTSSGFRLAWRDAAPAIPARVIPSGVPFAAGDGYAWTVPLIERTF
jgi:hypothetical protein